MSHIKPREGGRLAGRVIAILMEADYVEPELDYYLRRFPEEGAQVILLTRLWGQESLTFHGHEYQVPIEVDGDLEAYDSHRLAELDALIVPSGMVSDRLRYSEDVAGTAPAVRLLRDAFANPGLLKGIICHGMWLAAPIPEVIRGRRVTCHNNLIGDIRNMGGRYTDQDVVVDRDLVTARSADHCHLFARMIIDLLTAGQSLRVRPGAAEARRRGIGESREPTPRPVVPDTALPDTAVPDTAVRGAGVRTVQDVRPDASARTGAAVVNEFDFTVSDLIAGYVTAFDPVRRVISVRTSDDRPYEVNLTGATSAEFLRNLGEPYTDASSSLDRLLTPGQHIFAHGTFYPEAAGHVFEAARLIFSRRAGYSFEQPDWWVRQLRELASYYRRAQFGETGQADYSAYRTTLRLGGEKTSNYRQETDTISRLVYGMTSAYMLTGNDDFLDVAENGADYLRDHMRFVDRDEDVVYWYHGIDVAYGVEKKLFASEFGDDYNTIPMYEQIYALGGLTQLYRATGDERISADIDGTLRLFHKFFHDPRHGGYYSHIDPVNLSPLDQSLGPNRARKNWNSIGDHAPAYLINLFLATGNEQYAAMLADTYDHVVRHMPEQGSPFVQERFHEDWSPDRGWGWQQNRAVVGHNMKIAWNLMRIDAITPKESYRELAVRIGRSMPEFGRDRQRGGWYDVLERERPAGQRGHRFTWHDRKAWWQQEQAILAYQILAGYTGDAEFLRHDREASAFYNAFFLDHDDGGVYFNVLADGLPYLVGNERLKGSHSMSLCHAAELCYFATIYQKLLLRREPLTLWFRPRHDGFRRDRMLRVAPDAFPPGRVLLDWVEVDGRPYPAFDRTAMTVKLPESDSPLTVQAHLIPADE
jgi:putative intracellular protease/amidase/mannose/cellobiose epimerase-like protein (N-acyl-D-glucosamine 2-epimerase family)